jgi:hypothetical protein
MGTLRKILTTGMGAALMADDTLRNAISDINVTKQATGYIVRQALKGKEEVSKVLIGEVTKFLARINIHEEIRKAMSGLTVEVEAKIHFSSDRSSRKPSMRIKKLRAGKS